VILSLLACLDPCRLVRQVNQFGKLTTKACLLLFDPCRLVRQVKEFGKLDATP
jgi:hypothetical protein